MNLYQVVILFAIGISFVFGGKGNNSIKKLLSECTNTTKEMQIKSKAKMDENDAKNFVQNLGKISRISEIPNESDRKIEWKKNPELRVLKTKMNNLSETFELPPDERDKILQSNQGMKETVAKLSLLDPENQKSPLKGKDIKKYLKQGSNSIGSTIKKGELKVKLIFRKLIPPSQDRSGLDY